MDIDDDRRWLIALISGTGMRLSEAAGLCSTDIVLDEGIPFLQIQAHSHLRLKTTSSIRKLPLVGCSLWAANRLAEQTVVNIAFHVTQTKIRATVILQVQLLTNGLKQLLIIVP